MIFKLYDTNLEKLISGYLVPVADGPSPVATDRPMHVTEIAKILQETLYEKAKYEHRNKTKTKILNKILTRNLR